MNEEITTTTDTDRKLWQKLFTEYDFYDPDTLTVGDDMIKCFADAKRGHARAKQFVAMFIAAKMMGRV